MCTPNLLSIKREELMGNRAVIEFKNQGIGIYLHWNGGRPKVEAFLQAASDLGIRSDDYGPARLCQIIGNFMGGGLSLGIGILDRLDTNNGDNGTYVVEHWKIVDRKHHDWPDDSNPEETKATYESTMRVNRPIFGRGE